MNQIRHEPIDGWSVVADTSKDYLEIRLEQKTMVYGVLLKAQTEDDAAHAFRLQRSADMNMWYTIGSYEPRIDDVMTMMIVKRFAMGFRVSVKGSSSSSSILLPSHDLVVNLYK